MVAIEQLPCVETPRGVRKVDETEIGGIGGSVFSTDNANAATLRKEQMLARFNA